MDDLTLTNVLEAIATAFPDVTVSAIDHSSVGDRGITKILFKNEPKQKIECSLNFDEDEQLHYTTNLKTPITGRFNCKEPNESVEPKSNTYQCTHFKCNNKVPRKSMWCSNHLVKKQVKYCKLPTCPNKALKNRNFCSGVCDEEYNRFLEWCEKEEKIRICKFKYCHEPVDDIYDYCFTHKPTTDKDTCICPESRRMAGIRMSHCQASIHFESENKLCSNYDKSSGYCGIVENPGAINESFCSDNSKCPSYEPKKEKATEQRDKPIRDNNSNTNSDNDVQASNITCICPGSVRLRGNKLTTCKSSKHAPDTPITVQCLFDHCTEPVDTNKHYCFTHNNQLYPENIPPIPQTEELKKNRNKGVLTKIKCFTIGCRNKPIAYSIYCSRHKHTDEVSDATNNVGKPTCKHDDCNNPRQRLDDYCSEECPNAKHTPQKGKEIKKTLDTTDTPNANNVVTKKICKYIRCTENRGYHEEYCSRTCKGKHEQLIKDTSDLAKPICKYKQCHHTAMTSKEYCIYHVSSPDRCICHELILDVSPAVCPAHNR